MSDVLNVERRGHVLVATLNRPERMNALSPQLHQDMRDTWKVVQSDPSVRAIVITGAGTRAFCTGMDLQAHAERGGPPPAKDDVRDELRTTPLAYGLWLPTVVAVNGVCTGSGLHFVADADSRARIGDRKLPRHARERRPGGRVGADFTDTADRPRQRAPSRGVGRAHGRLNAAEALRISLVDEVVEPERLLDRAVELGELMATGSPAAIEVSKRAIRASLERPMSEAMQYGWELLLAHRDHPDSLEGPKAFVEKREARWQ